mgnify:CR=1 FL=1
MSTSAFSNTPAVTVLDGRGVRQKLNLSHVVQLLT